MSAETKTCTKCGETKALDQYRPQKRKCRKCEAQAARDRYAGDLEKHREASRADYARHPDRRRKASKRYYDKNLDELRARARARARARVDEVRVQRQKQQADTSSLATNRGKEWTGPELELLADYRRTSYDVAIALGRTLRAVQAQRRLLHIDPRKARMAGTDVEPTS